MLILKSIHAVSRENKFIQVNSWQLIKTLYDFDIFFRRKYLRLTQAEPFQRLRSTSRTWIVCFSALRKSLHIARFLSSSSCRGPSAGWRTSRWLRCEFSRNRGCIYHEKWAPTTWWRASVALWHLIARPNRLHLMRSVSLGTNEKISFTNRSTSRSWYEYWRWSRTSYLSVWLLYCSPCITPSSGTPLRIRQWRKSTSRSARCLLPSAPSLLRRSPMVKALTN